MQGNLNHYRTALYLSIVVALTNCIVCGLSVFLRPQAIRDAIGLCVLSLAIPAGLWLGSNFVRFAGAIFDSKDIFADDGAVFSVSFGLETVGRRTVSDSC